MTLRFLVYTTRWLIEPFSQIRNVGRETSILAFFSPSSGGLKHAKYGLPLKIQTENLK